MTTLQLRISDSLKFEAESLFTSLGLDISTAIRVFLNAAVRTKGMPFEIKHTPDYSLAEAVNDSRKRINLHGPFSSAREAVDSMLGD